MIKKIYKIIYTKKLKFAETQQESLFGKISRSIEYCTEEIFTVI